MSFLLLLLLVLLLLLLVLKLLLRLSLLLLLSELSLLVRIHSGMTSELRHGLLLLHSLMLELTVRTLDGLRSHVLLLLLLRGKRKEEEKSVRDRDATRSCKPKEFRLTCCI